MDGGHDVQKGLRAFVSHVAEDGRIELVRDHLREVAEMAAEFARPFGAEAGRTRRGWPTISGSTRRNSKTAFCVEAARWIIPRRGRMKLFEHLNAKLLAYCVAGHHGGLPDGGSSADVDGGSTLLSRIDGARQGELPDYHAFADEVELPIAGKLAFRMPPDPKDGFALAFLARMVFSLLGGCGLPLHGAFHAGRRARAAFDRRARCAARAP